MQPFIHLRFRHPRSRPNPRRAQPAPARRDGGFGLIEVLVAVLVLAVGLLGLAQLQAFGLRNNQSAYLRTMASLQANSMADRIRANIVGADAGAYVWTSGHGTTLPTDDCVSAECTTAAAVANHDIREWITESARMPSGWGRITRNGALYTVTVMWDDDRTGVTGTSCSGNPDVDLKCYAMTFEP